VEPERKSEERDHISCGSESSSSQRFATTERSDKRRGETGDDCPQAQVDCPQVERRVLGGPPRRYGTRSTRERVNVDRKAGIQEISAVEDANTKMTGGDGNMVRVVSARSW